MNYAVLILHINGILSIPDVQNITTD